MNNSIVLNRKAVIIKIAIVIAAVVSSIVLPQLFHMLGVISGTGAEMGSIFLPMHIPVLLAGFLGGPVVGLLAGAASPIASFFISGMPTAVLLPYIIIELAVYGLISGLISNNNMNFWGKMIIVQISGRLARILAIMVSIYIFGSKTIALQSAMTFITTGILGMILQWIVVPFLADKMKGVRKFYE